MLLKPKLYEAHLIIIGFLVVLITFLLITQVWGEEQDSKALLAPFIGAHTQQDNPNLYMRLEPCDEGFCLQNEYYSWRYEVKQSANKQTKMPVFAAKENGDITKGEMVSWAYVEETKTEPQLKIIRLSLSEQGKYVFEVYVFSHLATKTPYHYEIREETLPDLPEIKQVTPDIETFFGDYVGISEDREHPEWQRDLDVSITSYRKGHGFILSWTTIMYQKHRYEEGVKRRVYESKFEPTNIDNIFRFVPNKNPFKISKEQDYFWGDPIVWARLEHNVMMVYLLGLEEDYSYTLQKYYRIVTDKGLKLIYHSENKGKINRTVEGILARVKNDE